jgi:hypothetical protein
VLTGWLRHAGVEIDEMPTRRAAALMVARIEKGGIPPPFICPKLV